MTLGTNRNSVTQEKLLTPTRAAISRAVAALLAGQLIGLPTETVYGLAARGDQKQAVAKIFQAKNRPRSNPLILHVACLEDALSLLAGGLPEPLRRRAERLSGFWPGPLTLIGPRHRSVLDQVTAGGDTVAIRVPDHPVALAVLRELAQTAGIPIPVAAPSANVSNYVSPTTAEHVADGVGERVELILDGGPCRVGLESTILYLGTETSSARILRRGAISSEQLSDALAESVTDPQQAHTSPATDSEKLIAAPGQFSKHYSPRTTLVLLPDDSPFHPERVSDQSKRVLRIEFGPIESERVVGDSELWTFSPDGDLTTAASRLYATLRRADEVGFDRIEVVPCAERGLGIAIMDRLRRASRR